MLTYIKWSFWIVFWTILATFLHYTLPRYDTIRVTNTYTKRVDFGDNSWFWANANTGDAVNVTNRDVFFIEGIGPSGRPKVYRNEDTGWGWPPYFKFDTTNLQAEATDYKSSAENPVWVAVRHYGWRNQFISIFPNAVAIEKVAGPDARKHSLTTITILILLGLLVWFIWARLRRFRRNRIDPLLDDAEDSWARTQFGARSWWNSWKGPSRR